MSAESTVEALITEQSERVQEALDAAIQYGDLAQTAAVAIVSLPSVPPVDIDDVVVPLPDDEDQSDAWEAFFGSAYAEFGPAFTAAWNEFIEEFFPEVNGCIPLLVDAWICNTIQNGGTGLPATIETQIWDRARSAEVELSNEATDNALSEWAGRGFSLPPGALTGRVQEIQKKAYDKLSTIRRDIAIKNQEIEIANVRFAIEQGNALRLGAINAAVNYIKAFFLPTELAIAKANGMMNARLQFNTTAAAYYGAIIGAARLQLDEEMFNSTLLMKGNEQFTALVTSNVNSRVNAAVGSASALGRTAAAGLGSINTLANIANVTNE